MTAPLEGTTILAVEQYGAGPWASMYLADMGARVIKIEDPQGGDFSRASGPHFLGPGDSHFFQTFNLGKSSVALDIKKPEGMAVFRRLAGHADAVMNNLRGDMPEKLGLTYPQLSDVNERLVCAHLSGYGRTGPRAAWPAFDYLAQAEAGFLDITGEPDAPPTRMGLSVIDYMTGVTCSFALTAALVGAMRSGKGRDVDVSLFDVAIHQLSYPATWYLNEKYVTTRKPRSGHPVVVPCEVFPTADGHIFIMCVLPKFWDALCRLIGATPLLEDKRFAGPADRLAHRDALVDLLDSYIKAKPTSHWLAVLAGQVPVAPILTIPEALDNPYLHATGGIAHTHHPSRPDFRTLASPIKIDGQRPIARPGPPLGDSTAQVLSEAGFSREEINLLAKSGVIGGVA